MEEILNKVKLSELPECTDFEGLYTLGVSRENASVKVPLKGVGEAAEQARTAAGQANAAAGVANTAANGANEAAGAANSAAGRAESAATSAGGAAARASSAAGAAETQAGNAETQGNYAKSQGDYAKQQGELAAIMASHPAKIENGTWWLYDPAREEYRDTGQTASVQMPAFSLNGNGELEVEYPDGWTRGRFEIDSEGNLAIVIG